MFSDDDFGVFGARRTPKTAENKEQPLCLPPERPPGLANAPFSRILIATFNHKPGSAARIPFLSVLMSKGGKKHLAQNFLYVRSKDSALARKSLICTCQAVAMTITF